MAVTEGASMRELTEQIRDYINGPRMSYLLSQDMETWNQICSSLDIIEDTDLRHHRGHGPSDFRVHN